jgi:integrase/recombinase XerD
LNTNGPGIADVTTLLGVSLMLVTGVRVSELVNISCTDIDLDDRAVRILGKGRRERVVYLANERLTAFLGSYLRLRQRLAIGHDVLLFNRRGQPLSAAAMRDRLIKAARAAQIDTRVTPHMLRHTAATQLVEAGVDIRLVQRLLGHASLSTTEIYAHVSDTALKRAVVSADILERTQRG